MKFLINSLPSSVLNDQVLFSCLYPVILLVFLVVCILFWTCLLVYSLCFCWISSNSKNIPVLQSSQQEVFYVCRCHILWVHSILLSTESSYYIRVYSSSTICSFASTCFCLWCLFASVTGRHYNATCTKASSEKDFRHIYTHQQKIPGSELVQADSTPVEGSSPKLSAPPSDLDVPIAIHKGK